MRRKTFIISTCVIIIIAIFYWLSDFSINNILPRPALPAKYAAYHDVDSGITSKQLQFSPLYSIEGNTRLDDEPPLFNAANKTVLLFKVLEIKKNESSDLFKTYVKLDLAGNIIDTLNCGTDWPSLFADYLVTEDTYCSWVINGDTTRHQFSEQNTALTEDSTTLDKHFKTLYQSASLVRYYRYYDLHAHRLDSMQVDKVIFQQNGKWISLLGKDLSDYEYHGYPSKAKSAYEPMRNLANNSHIEHRNQFVYLEYFYKEHFSKGRGPSWGSPTGQGTQDEWEGSGYINLIFEKDTLHIKQEMKMEDRSLFPNLSPYSAYSPTYYFTSNRLHFGLFSNRSYVYIIKPKAK